MSVKDTLGKIGKAAVSGGAWYLEQASYSNSHNKNFTEEQRAGMAEFSGRMHDFRERLNGNNEDEEDDDYYY